MDPTETLRLAADAIARGDTDAAREYLGYYAGWRRNGGFNPASIGGIDGDAEWKRLLTEANQCKPSP